MKPTRWLFLACSLCCVGCFGTSTSSVIDQATWVEKDIAVDDVTISLGHLENVPVARVTRGGNPTADVMVFCGQAESETGELLTEIATVYDRESGIYVAEQLPAVKSGHVIRFRVVLPEAQEPWVGHMASP